MADLDLKNKLPLSERLDQYYEVRNNPLSWGVHSKVTDPHWFNVDPDPYPAFFLLADPHPGFWWPKIDCWKFHLYFFYQILQFTYPEASIKDAQAAGEAFSPQKRTFSTSKHEIYFCYYCGSLLTSWIRVRIGISNANPDPATHINADPDPKPRSVFSHFICTSRSIARNLDTGIYLVLVQYLTFAV